MFVNNLEKKQLTTRTVINCINSITARRGPRHDIFSCWKLLRLWGLSEWTSALCYKTAKLWRCWRCSAFENRFHLNAYINGKTQSHKHSKRCKKQNSIAVFIGGGMDRVSPNLYAFIQLPKEAMFG